MEESIAFDRLGKDDSIIETRVEERWADNFQINNQIAVEPSDGQAT